MWPKDSLPEVLYLQLDNCFREKKNKYLFGYCALLVELNIFREACTYVRTYYDYQFKSDIPTMT